MNSQQQPAQTNQVQTVQLPAWVDNASQGNYAQASQVADNLGPTAPQNVAGWTGLQNQAVDMLGQGSAGAASMYGAGSGLLGTAANYVQSAAPVTAGSVPLFAGARDVDMPAYVQNVMAKGFLDRDVNAYMNPYTQKVIDATDQASRRDEALSLQKNSDANRAAGAWGGSRDALTNAVIQSEGVRNRAQTDAGLRSAGFTDAANRIMADNQLDLTGQTANQGKDLTLNAQKIQAQGMNQNADIAKGQINAGIGEFNVGTNLDAQKFNSNLSLQQGAMLGNLGSAYGNMGQQYGNTTNAQSLLAANLGQSQQATSQAFYDAQTANANAIRQNPIDQINLKLAALGMSPYGKTTTSNSTSTGGTSTNTGMQVLGAGLSILPALFGGGGFMPSDRNVKKDIKRIGKVPGTDLNKYEFKYKKGFMGSDMDDAPQIGLMAQDVEKKVPGAVHKVNVGGKKVRAVDYGHAIRGASHGFMGS